MNLKFTERCHILAKECGGAVNEDLCLMRSLFNSCINELIANCIPICRYHSCHGPFSLNIWLIKHGEDPVAVICFELGIDVLFLLRL